MAQQYANFENYLAVADVNLSEIGTSAYDVLLLPENAEVLNVNVEVLEAAASGKKVDVGFGDTTDFFCSQIAVDALANFNSSKVTRISKTDAITIKASAAAAKGVLRVRAHYFLPSKILTEFAD